MRRESRRAQADVERTPEAVVPVPREFDFAWALGFLGVRKALGANGRLPSSRQVEERAERWRPWRAYATLHLWRSLGGDPT